MGPETENINRPRTLDLNHTIQKWPTSQIKPMRVTSHFPRIVTTLGYDSFHPFGFRINQKGLGTNVRPNFGQYVNGPRSSKCAAKS